MAGQKKSKSPLRRPQSDTRRNDRGTPAPRYGVISQVAQLIDLLAKFDSPADAVISRFFKDHPELGGRDRPVLAEAAYCWLRYRFRINHLAAAAEGGSVVMRQAKLALFWSGAPEQIWAQGRQEDNAWLSRVIQVPVDGLAVEPRTCLPGWFYDKLNTQFGEVCAESFALSVLSAAPLDLRVNLLKATSQAVTQGLLELGIEVTPIEGLTEGLRAVGKPIVGKTDLFLNGFFEVQDAGSQWVSHLVAARRGDLVVDFCAGAGGKTLAIGADMRNTGRIVALDTSEKRLAKLKPRAARAGMSNFYTLVINDETDARLNKYFGKADRVLVDVPCSGMGTLRRNPDLKFRQDENTLMELLAKQRSILENASRLVKPDGRLVYITCSVLQEENEAIVEEFLVNNPSFRLRRWTEVLNPGSCPLHADTEQAMLRLWPQAGESDGFFAAVLQRAKS